MVMSYKAGPELGKIEVYTTENKGHPVEFWAERCIEKIIHVSEDADPKVKEQVNKYKDNIKKVIELYMQNAIKSDRITLNNKLQELGFGDVAEVIRKN